MYVLTRKISPYTGPDLFLGLFTDIDRANAARQKYLSSIVSHDPWLQQGYRTPDPEADVLPLKIDDQRTDSDLEIAYLVSAYYESFGQILREFLTIFSTQDSADAYAASKEDDEDEPGPNWCEVDEVVINNYSVHQGAG